MRGANRGHALARSLSGGNQQKLVVGRELTRKHNIVIFVQPTRGLDMGAIQFIHKKIMEDARNGVTIILISYELDEILEISSRIAVMSKGRIVFDAPARKVTRQLIGKYISHHNKSSDVNENVKKAHAISQMQKQSKRVAKGGR